MTEKLTRLAALLLLVAVAGCSGLGVEDDRGEEPLSQKIVTSMAARGMTPADPVFVRIYKKESELEVWKAVRGGRYALVKTYPICRWSGKLGPKTRSGDRQAPEGFYLVTARQLNPRSQFHLSFNLGYPNPLEAAQGYSGEALMVHGACSSSGCYAIGDANVSEVYALLREALRGGQQAVQVQALPFRMTSANMAAHRNDPNYAFWENLEEGVDHFNTSRQPPKIGYCGGRYVFNADPADPSAVMDPLQPCPEFLPSAAADQVAALHAGEQLAAASLVHDAPARMSYQDGGMHPVYREFLRSRGAEALSKATSKRTPVSRPEAALADPYPGQPPQQ